MEIPGDWGLFLAGFENRHVFTSEDSFLRVVTFVLEAKVSGAETSARQLTLYLCSAQNQRRALGFHDGYVFGATFVGHDFTLYVSRWQEDQVVSLSSPPHCIINMQ